MIDEGIKDLGKSTNQKGSLEKGVDRQRGGGERERDLSDLEFGNWFLSIDIRNEAIIEQLVIHEIHERLAWKSLT